MPGKGVNTAHSVCFQEQKVSVQAQKFVHFEIFWKG